MGCGTGDIGKLFLNTVKFKGSVYNVDPNKKMLDQGKKRFKNLDNISWHIGNAENLKFKSNLFDYYTISFGLRNTKDISKSLKEAYRVLKPGGRFLCLEFSKISNSNLNFLYKNYSKIIPKVGKFIVGKSEPYEYLIKSIDKFINQYQLIKLMNENGFENCKFRDLSGGIVSIHSGWKV